MIFQWIITVSQNNIQTKQIKDKSWAICLLIDFVDAITTLIFVTSSESIYLLSTVSNFSSLLPFGDKSSASTPPREYPVSRGFVDWIGVESSSIHDAEREDINGDWRSGWSLIFTVVRTFGWSYNHSTDLSRSQIKNIRWYFVGGEVGIVDYLKLKLWDLNYWKVNAWYTRYTMHPNHARDWQ